MKMKFKEITKPEDLISYLHDSQRLNGVKLLNKYLSLDTLIKIFNSESLLLNNPERMNDKYEYKQFKQNQWEKICFSSFIAQSTENMAMWSMYAQPWRDGVMISIPPKAIRDLIKNGVTIRPATKDYKPINKDITSDCNLFLSRIVYVNDKNITCTSRDDRNDRFNNISNRPYNFPELAGYVKDSVWDYEKEVRLRIDLPASCKYDAAFLQLPETFLSQIRITAGPRFKDNADDIKAILPEKYRDVITTNSILKEFLIRIPCDDCNCRQSCSKQLCNNCPY